jgi:hypothetical protein
VTDRVKLSPGTPIKFLGNGEKLLLGLKIFREEKKLLLGLKIVERRTQENFSGVKNSRAKRVDMSGDQENLY